MEIFNIFSVTEPFKTAASGSGIGIPYTIQYNMSVMGTELDGTLYIRNYGKGGNSFNAEAFASNHIYLNGTTQSVPYIITSGIEVCYYDVATKAFVKDTASSPYTMTTSNSSLFSSTITMTDADLAELTADANKIYRIWFLSETLESGFSKSDIGNFYGGNEGLASGANVQDLSVNLGVDYIANTIVGSSCNVSNIVDNSADVNIPSEVVAPTEVFIDFGYSEVVDTTLYQLVMNVSCTSGQIHIGRLRSGSITDGISDELIDEVLSSGETFEFGRLIRRRTALAKGFRLDLFKIGLDTQAGSASILYTLKEVTTVEIGAYDTAARTTLANQSNGASNLKLIRDGSGRTTGTAAANTTQWEADGRTAVTNWTITAPFTIGEIINGDPYVFTSNGDRFKNLIFDGTYTIPTGIWTLDEFGFDGVTPVTVRGVTGMIDEVVIP